MAHDYTTDTNVGYRNSKDPNQVREIVTAISERVRQKANEWYKKAQDWIGSGALTHDFHLFSGYDGNSAERHASYDNDHS